MRKWLSRAAALLLCMMPLLVAAAEPATQTDILTVDDPMLQVGLSVQMEAISQFGETRVTQSNNMLRHIGLELQVPMDGTTEKQGIRLLVDDDPAATVEITCDANGSSFTLDGALSYRSDDDTAAQLYGEGVDLAFGNIRYALLSIPDDAVTLAETIIAQDTEHTVRKSIESKVRGMGTATVKHTVSYKSADAAAFGKSLLQACPDGELKRIISTLTFTGEQEMRVLHDSNGHMLKIAYEGNCGKDKDHQRKVTVSWLLWHTEKMQKDNLTITAPAVRGTDRSGITFVRSDVKENGAREITISYKDSENLNKKKTEDTLEATVKQDKKGKITGNVTMKQKTDDETITLKLEPALTLDEAACMADGTLVFDYMHDKKSLYKGTITIDAKPMQAWSVIAGGSTFLADEKAAASAAEAVQNKITHELVCRLLLLPAPDAEYLLADLDQETRMKLITQAEEALRRN